MSSIKETGPASYAELRKRIDEVMVDLNKYTADPFPGMEGYSCLFAKARGSMSTLRDYATQFPSFRRWKVIELEERVKKLRDWNGKEKLLKDSDELIEALLELKKKVSEEEGSAHTDPSPPEQVKELAKQVKELASEVLKLKDSIRDLEEKSRETGVREWRSTK